jgi:plastocyanin
MKTLRIGRAVSAAMTLTGLALMLAPQAGARGLTAPVTAGPPLPLTAKHLDLDGFFPATTRIHVGDRISWSINGFHTVSILPAGKAAPPLIIPAPANPIAGKLDAIGAPMWFNGQPNLEVNPVAAAPSGGKVYAGKGFLNSGLPAPTNGPPPPFVVKFTTAGTYTFHCLVHPGMQGVVKVLPKRKKVPSAAQDRLAALNQGAVAVGAARVLARVKPPAATVLAGNDSGPVAWLRFFPEKLRVKVGTTVNFRIASKREIHTITFGPAAYTTQIESTFTTPSPNAAGPPTLIVNPFGAYPSDPPPLPPYTGANHGNGFEAAGILAPAGGPLPSAASITFTTPGVYKFECVIHENMDGTVTVTK